MIDADIFVVGNFNVAKVFSIDIWIFEYLNYISGKFIIFKYPARP